jgi:hypothetical protein
LPGKRVEPNRDGMMATMIGFTFRMAPGNAS